MVMYAKPARGLFITGTHTGVGKTYVTALIARALVRQGLRVGVYKPVLSGFDTDLAAGGDPASSQDDDVVLWRAAGQPGELRFVCPQRFAAPVAPPIAAHLAGGAVDPRLLREGARYWQQHSDIVLVEGAGGLMSPVTDDEYVADIALDLGFPLVVVAANELGVINQTLQTLITAATFQSGLEIAGIVLNHTHPPDPADASLASNRTELARRCSPPVLAELAWQAEDFDASIPWHDLARHGTCVV